MHILEIPSFFPPYGGEFCLEQAKALTSNGHEVRIASHLQLGVRCGWHDYLMRPYGLSIEQMDGIEVWRSYLRGIPRMVRPNVMRWLSGVQRLVATYVEQRGVPDVFHAHCVKWAGRAAMLLSQQYDRPYVITEHLPAMIYAEEFGAPPSDAWQIPLLKEALHRAHRVVLVAEELKNDLSPYFGADYSSVVISNVVDTSFFRSIERQHMATFRFCAIGNFIPRKGYDVLSQAFHILRQQGCRVSLTVAGRGTNSSACRTMMGNDVSCLGEQDREYIRRMLYANDALVLPSRSESQGLVLLEALSTGIPVVTTDAVPQSVRRLEGCLTARHLSAEALAESMQQAMTLSFDSEKLSRGVRQYCSPEVIGSQLSRLFQTL